MLCDPRGLWICFEGLDGCGKSTQIQKLKEWLTSKGYIVNIIKDPQPPTASLVSDNNITDNVSRALFMYGGRRWAYTQLIHPALNRGEIVICDRWAYSTRIYQFDRIEADRSIDSALNEATFRNCNPNEPDLTIVIGVPGHICRQRVHSRGELSGFDNMSVEEYNLLQTKYSELAIEKEKCVLIDGTPCPDEVFVMVSKVMLSKM